MSRIQFPKPLILAVAASLESYSFKVNGVFNRDDVLPVIKREAKKQKITNKILWDNLALGLLERILETERTKTKSRFEFFESNRLVILGNNDLVQNMRLTKELSLRERQVHDQNLRRQIEAAARLNTLFDERDAMFDDFRPGATLEEVLQRTRQRKEPSYQRPSQPEF